MILRSPDAELGNKVILKIKKCPNKYLARVTAVQYIGGHSDREEAIILHFVYQSLNQSKF